MDLKIDEVEKFISELKRGHELIPVMCEVLKELRMLRIELHKHFEDEAKMFMKARKDG